jgi:hypothetical protein
MIFHLSDASGKTIPLAITESVLAAAGGLRALNNREVIVTTEKVSADQSVPTEVRSIRLAP